MGGRRTPPPHSCLSALSQMMGQRPDLAIDTAKEAMLFFIEQLEVGSPPTSQPSSPAEFLQPPRLIDCRSPR